VASRLLRPGGSWSAKAAAEPDVHLLVTLVSYDPDEIPDRQGRRVSDRCVGEVLGAELASEICVAVNVWRGGSDGQ
jgi:hypothetical protein